MRILTGTGTCVFVVVLIMLAGGLWAFFCPFPCAVEPSYTVKLMIVRAYCPCELCCGEWADGHTASGMIIGRGIKLIAAPPEYPFGTRMKVPGYGIAPVLDRGEAVKGNKLEVLFQSHQEALEWGVKELKVRIMR